MTDHSERTSKPDRVAAGQLWRWNHPRLGTQGFRIVVVDGALAEDIGGMRVSVDMMLTSDEWEFWGEGDRPDTVEVHVEKNVSNV